MRYSKSKSKTRYSNNYYLKANNLSLLDYATKLGHEFKKEGNEYRCKDDGFHSLLINPSKNTFYWSAHNLGGGTVQFAMTYDNITRDEAIERLLGSSVLLSHDEHLQQNNITKEEKKPFELPEKNGDYKRLFAYLNKTRCIDYQTIKQFVDLGKIYQEKKHGNIVFISFNEKEQAVGVTLRGTLPDKRFRGDIEETVKKYPFCLAGTTNRLYVYESPIDLMSDLSLTKLKGFEPKPHHRIDLGGTYSDPLFYYLEQNPHIDEIVLRLDNDEAGEKGIRTMGGELLAMRKKVHALFPVGEDVNQDLQNMVAELQKTHEEDMENEL